MTIWSLLSQAARRITTKTAMSSRTSLLSWGPVPSLEKLVDVNLPERRAPAHDQQVVHRLDHRRRAGEIVFGGFRPERRAPRHAHGRSRARPPRRSPPARPTAQAHRRAPAPRRGRACGSRGRPRCGRPRTREFRGRRRRRSAAWTIEAIGPMPDPPATQTTSRALSLAPMRAP